MSAPRVIASLWLISRFLSKLILTVFDVFSLLSWRDVLFGVPYSTILLKSYLILNNHTNTGHLKMLCSISSNFISIFSFHSYNKIWSQKVNMGLPWWRSGWESACQCRGHGFEPWSGKIPRATEQMGPWATTTEPARLEPVLRNKRPRQWEARAPRWRVAPACHNWRGPSHRNEDPTHQKINK